MGKNITPSNAVLTAMDSGGADVAVQLPYYDNMLYLPLPNTAECTDAGDSIYEDKIVNASVKKKETPLGHVNT